MKFTLTALFDDDTRAQIKAAVLGEARNIARSAIENEIKAEVKRVGAALDQKIRANYWEYRKLFEDSIKGVIKENWADIHKQIVQIATTAVDANVQEKLRTKTVWEAEKQDAYVRKVVRDELRQMLKA